MRRSDNDERSGVWECSAIVFVLFAKTEEEPDTTLIRSTKREGGADLDLDRGKLIECLFRPMLKS